MTRFFHRPRFSFGVVLLLGVALILTGCDEGSLNAPEIADSGQTEGLFESYVALGNSITAGLQSGGINTQTQSKSYAVLLADSAMGTPFGTPQLATPGCPPPLVQFFNDSGVPDPQRPSGTTASTCALRSPTASQVRNVAVPRATLADVLFNIDPTGNATPPNPDPNELTQFILGGRTQIEAALDANPTFASLWIGNNNVLEPALSGNPSAATSVSQFQTEYTNILDKLETSENLKGAALIGVVNPLFVPFVSPGPVYEGLEQQGQLPPNLKVENCDTTSTQTGLSPRVSVQYGFTLIDQAAKNPSQTITLDCGATGTPVLTLPEAEAVAGTVQQYNAIIQQEASDRGFAYLNPNAVLQALYQDLGSTPADPTDDPIPKFPDRDSSEPFGPFFSLDGVHPNDATHRLIANELIKLLNQPEAQGGYGTNLPTLNNVPSVP